MELPEWHRDRGPLVRIDGSDIGFENILKAQLEMPNFGHCEQTHRICFSGVYGFPNVQG